VPYQNVLRAHHTTYVVPVTMFMQESLAWESKGKHLRLSLTNSDFEYRHESVHSSSSDYNMDMAIINQAC